jgi:hypothetical protein
MDVSTAPTFSTLLPGYDKKQIAPTETSLNVVGLSSGVVYYYRLYAEINSSTNLVCDPREQITIPTTPALNPITITTSNGFTAAWPTITGESFYEIDISADNFSTFFPGYEGKRLENLNGPNISVTLNELSAGTGYSVRIRAGNTAGVSPNSSERTFSTSGAFTPLSVSVTENSATEIKGSPVEVKFLVINGIGDLSIQSVYSGLTSEESYPVCIEQRGDSAIVLVEEYMFEEADVEVTVIVTDALGQEAEASTIIGNLYMAVDEPRIIINPPYPNPASDQVSFRVSIPENAQQSPIIIRIVDLFGRPVQTLNESVSGGGNYTVKWDRKDSQDNAVMPGIYLARIYAGSNQVWYRVIIK